MVGREQHRDCFLLVLCTTGTARDCEKRARDFLHLGSIIQIPQCWIFDDAGKGKRVRRGDGVRENGVRGKMMRGKPEEGAVLLKGPSLCPSNMSRIGGDMMINADSTYHVKLLLYVLRFEMSCIMIVARKTKQPGNMIDQLYPSDKYQTYLQSDILMMV